MPLICELLERRIASRSGRPSVRPGLQASRHGRPTRQAYQAAVQHCVSHDGALFSFPHGAHTAGPPRQVSPRVQGVQLPRFAPRKFSTGAGPREYRRAGGGANTQAAWRGVAGSGHARCDTPPRSSSLHLALAWCRQPRHSCSSTCRAPSRPAPRRPAAPGPPRSGTMRRSSSSQSCEPGECAATEHTLTGLSLTG